VTVSDATNKRTIKEGVENIIVESCFPVKLAHGHIMNLIGKGIRRIFMPSVISLKNPSEEIQNTFSCPYAQSLPYTSRASIDFDRLGVRVDSPVVYFGRGRKVALANLTAFGKTMGKSAREIERAFTVADDMQNRFGRACLDEGSRFLSAIRPDEKVMVLIGRPYNSMDPGANLNVHRKLADLGVSSMPIDMLPLDGVEADDDLKDMYWGYGQRILRAAKIVRSHPNLYAVYITNFGCGPDSFITHFFKKIMEGKPFLQLEIDEHSGDAGIITRLEAFLDSIRNARTAPKAERSYAPAFVRDGHARKIYIPYMSDHCFAFAGAFRACGVEAEVMEESDAETVRIGRRHTLGKECFPCILTTGDMLKTSRRPDFRPDRSAFFMPSGSGPCRFGQYHRFHRMVLSDHGFGDVPIYSPNQDGRLYRELHILGGRFTRLGWRAIVATDLLIKMLHQTRPYETVPGQTDRVYREELRNIERAIEQGGDAVYDAIEKAVDGFLAIPVTDRSKPVVGVVGEIYIRSNRFSNNDLVRKIEEFGGEAWLAPITEWVTYVN
jgi:predicted nucleotide-binding protein (sugar kinase/HSP70/actin superfamily)